MDQIKKMGRIGTSSAEQQCVRGFGGFAFCPHSWNQQLEGFSRFQLPPTKRPQQEAEQELFQGAYHSGHGLFSVCLMPDRHTAHIRDLWEPPVTKNREPTEFGSN